MNHTPSFPVMDYRFSAERRAPENQAHAAKLLQVLLDFFLFQASGKILANLLFFSHLASGKHALDRGIAPPPMMRMPPRIVLTVRASPNTTRPTKMATELPVPQMVPLVSSRPGCGQPPARSPEPQDRR